jgi:hypothetical protein
MSKLAKKNAPISIDFNGISNDELFSIRVLVDKEFKRREIRFDVGDIGETVVIDFFNKTPGLSNLSRASRGTRNVDAISRNGDRYSIKTLKSAKKTGTVYPDSAEENKQLFEYMLLVQLNEEYELKSVHRFSWQQFLKVRSWDKTMKAWYIPKTAKALNQSETIL